MKRHQVERSHPQPLKKPKKWYEPDDDRDKSHLPQSDDAKIRRIEAFSQIYSEGWWGRNPPSGDGSTLEATRTTRIIIQDIIEKYDINSMADLACGDMTWMPTLLRDLDERRRKRDASRENEETNQNENSLEKKEFVPFRYIGCDVVPTLVEQHSKSFADEPAWEFKHADMCCDPPPTADLLFCKDVFQHLPEKHIMSALRLISKSNAKFLLCNTFPRQPDSRNLEDIGLGSSITSYTYIVLFCSSFFYKLLVLVCFGL